MITRHVHAGGRAKPCLRLASNSSALRAARLQLRRKGPVLIRAGVVDTILKPLTQSGQVPLMRGLDYSRNSMLQWHSNQLLNDQRGVCPAGRSGNSMTA